ncbi:hypothetical protein WP50_22550 [Lactiplantibacillus plantarum]|nr:hypothetical protein WP50_22550 [Lactiplantibacillus plantarum]
MNNNYANALNNWAAWDAVISATPEQTKDVEARFGKDIPAFTIPVGYVDNATLKAAPVKFDQRQKDLVVQVARLAPEKQQNHSIEAFVEVHKQFPDAKLELWGYANGDIEKRRLGTRSFLRHRNKLRTWKPALVRIFQRSLFRLAMLIMLR